MGCPSAACAECTRNCLLIHGKNKDPSSIVTSFFKVMIGDNFSKVLVPLHFFYSFLATLNLVPSTLLVSSTMPVLFIFWTNNTLYNLMESASFKAIE